MPGHAIADAENEIGEIFEDLRHNHGRCDQCAAIMINNRYCHEIGCPTDRRIRDLRRFIQLCEESEIYDQEDD